MKVVIIGGGAAGMIAAISASQNKKNEVIILEKNEKLGKKLYITGKGRCNITNACDKETFFKNVKRNPKFLFSSFNNFNNFDLMKLIEENGCNLKTERGNRVFPVSDKSSDIIKALTFNLKNLNVEIKLNTECKSIEKVSKEIKTTNCSNDDIKDLFIIKTNRGEITSDVVVVATGGLSYKTTGSTGDGYRFAEGFDINVLPQTPSLIPLNIKEIDVVKSMQGLTLKNIAIKIFDRDDEKNVLYKDFGELLFTHFGVSGPVILSASSEVNDFDKELMLSIDLKPALEYDKLDDRLIREINDNKNKKLKSIIETLLPSSMVAVFIDILSNKQNENVAMIKCSDISKELRKSIVNYLKDFRLTITGKRGFDEAIITRGGIDIKEINPKTMESKKVSNLYFVGEVLDLDALTGGFNIQIAASTAWTAGMSI